jgi:phage FluMu protein Com
MGVFNSIRLKQKCPYCKEVSEMEFQTKDGIDICYDHSKDSVFTVIDYDEHGKIRGIEFPDGL